MHLEDESRELVYSSDILRRARGDSAFTDWADLQMVLLDHYRKSGARVHFKKLYTVLTLV